MKRLTLYLSSLFIAALLFSSSPASADLVADKIIQGTGNIIDHVYIAEDANTYLVEMFLKSTATAGNTYSVALSDTYTAAATTYSLSKGTFWHGDIINTSTGKVLNDDYFVFANKTNSGITQSVFSWTFDKSSISIDLSTIVGEARDITNNLKDTTATPIPAAAWLFASGLFGLLGLKRKGMHTA